MLGLDTNVLVRLLIEDDAAQTRRARKLVDTAIAEEETVLVSLPVLLETEWVLRSRYEMPPETILGLFRAALEARELAFEDEAAVRSEEHTSELQSHSDLVCRLLLEKKKQNTTKSHKPQAMTCSNVD